MNRLTTFLKRHLGDVGVVFYTSLLIITAFVVTSALQPETVEAIAQKVLDATAKNVGWMYLMATTGFVLFIFFLAFSRFGNLRLGQENELPEFSFTSWLAMIFSGGMGVGLVFWGVAEPIMHLNVPPLGLAEPRSVEAAQLGMRYSFFHWGFHQWANFTLVGLAIAYVRFRHNSYGLISETFRPLLGERVDRGWGKAIDILAVVSTLFGVATTLGLGALQVNSGLSRLGVMDYSTTSQFMILGGLATLFTISAMTPLDKGIRHLSNANLVIASGLLLFVLVTGPTAFIFGELTQTLGEYLGNLIEMSLVTAPHSDEKWVEQWTMFYWAWGLSWAPFVGSFIARISRGRTIREFVMGVMVIPVALSMLWFSTFGGSAIHFELFEGVGIADAVAEEVPSGLYVLLDQLPWGGVAAVLAVILVSMFVVTSADSATFVLGMFTSKGVLTPTRFVRVLWGCLQLLMASVLLLSGGLNGLRTLSIVAAFPFMLLMVLMAFSLHKDLATDIRRREEKNAMMHARMEQWLLRESEREAERQEEEELHPSAPEQCPGLSRTGQSTPIEET
ncbi:MULTISPECIES: BCCT family transporter [Gammaproteobacteria]|jgi:glycine betaine transporter|uniref:Choline/carnitine/betaine transporter n=2 Tax=Gammaproteobacteria TaxID=1236 RepID=L0W8C6_9GAMM|nr:MULTISPECIES: BCCT family transporter [Gammaproteobacteria]MDZ7685444.1 BCCT family transporter [Gammaproteobacteria bacterium]EKF73224.1 choline/carnitine/betaine transporter [Alcanivorax hongdengensis A-11-3]MAN53133.1 BCCT family transporter [Marinimicrobium sp.]MDF1638245.1 BCCT family transporter [Alcanivorax jadensis]SEG27889.1 glycine betaine transporter [Alcanivorax sp. DSM 26293]|tara:strand:- start:96 stop:1778 length:1683 start_codon:yes stop_codon:yes gene_type:complete